MKVLSKTERTAEVVYKLFGFFTGWHRFTNRSSGTDFLFSSERVSSIAQLAILVYVGY